MTQRLFMAAVPVRNSNEAIDVYVEQLGFEVRLDNRLSDTKLYGNRWDLIQHSERCGY